MPRPAAQMSMVITNNNLNHFYNIPSSNTNLGVAVATPKAPSALNASMLQRVHNVRPGCGSCGRH
jgi:hypothetical protein